MTNVNSLHEIPHTVNSGEHALVKLTIACSTETVLLMCTMTHCNLNIQNSHQSLNTNYSSIADVYCVLPLVSQMVQAAPSLNTGRSEQIVFATHSQRCCLRKYSITNTVQLYVRVLTDSQTRVFIYRILIFMNRIKLKPRIMQIV